MHHLYILYSERIDKFYIGTSHDPLLRLHYHNKGKGWTKREIPWKLVFSQTFTDKSGAMQNESSALKKAVDFSINSLSSRRERLQHLYGFNFPNGTLNTTQSLAGVTSNHRTKVDGEYLSI